MARIKQVRCKFFSRDPGPRDGGMPLLTGDEWERMLAEIRGDYPRPKEPVKKPRKKWWTFLGFPWKV